MTKEEEKELTKKIEERAGASPHGWPKPNQKEKTKFIAGAWFGYYLAQSETSGLKQENKELKGLVEKAFRMGFDVEIGNFNKAWQQFKTENNIQ